MDNATLAGYVIYGVVFVFLALLIIPEFITIKEGMEQLKDYDSTREQTNDLVMLSHKMNLAISCKLADGDTDYCNRLERDANIAFGDYKNKYD